MIFFISTYSNSQHLSSSLNVLRISQVRTKLQDKNRNYACIIYYSRAFSSRGRQTRNLDLKDAFGNMDIVEQRNMLDGLLRGMLKQRLQKADKNFADDVKILNTYSYVGIIFQTYTFCIILDCKPLI